MIQAGGIQVLYEIVLYCTAGGLYSTGTRTLLVQGWWSASHIFQYEYCASTSKVRWPESAGREAERASAAGRAARRCCCTPMLHALPYYWWPDFLADIYVISSDRTMITARNE